MMIFSWRLEHLAERRQADVPGSFRLQIRLNDQARRA